MQFLPPNVFKEMPRQLRMIAVLNHRSADTGIHSVSALKPTSGFSHLSVGQEIYGNGIGLRILLFLESARTQRKMQI